MKLDCYFVASDEDFRANPVYVTLSMNRTASTLKNQDSRQAGSQQPISGKSLEENSLDV